ncbi:MAG TPA: hypothetical protein VLS88_17500 [Polyangiales bacterium]|nr:hypothetical protein [Polyangiales bacterium]
MRHRVMLGFVAVCALVALAGCKKSSTAADARADDDTSVRLIEKGDRPRTELRYDIPIGTATTSTTTFRAATLASSTKDAAMSVLPGLRLDVVSGPAEPTDRGVKLQVDVVRSEAIVPDGFDEALAQKLRASAAVADKIGGWVEIDDRGRVLDASFNDQTKRADLPVRLLRMIVNTRETLTRVRLPEEKVGLGARWESHRVITAYGFEIEQVSTYTLVDRAGNEIMLNVSVQQMARPQTIEFPDEGISVAVESLTGHAEGQIILDLNALESDASASGQVEDHLMVKTPEGTETIQVIEEYEVQIANTSALVAD